MKDENPLLRVAMYSEKPRRGQKVVRRPTCTASGFQTKEVAETVAQVWRARDPATFVVVEEAMPSDAGAGVTWLASTR